MKTRALIVCSFIFLIVVFSVAFILGYYNFYLAELQNFKVLGVVEQNSDTLVYFEKNKYAIKYDVIISDDKDNVIYTTTVTDSFVKLDQEAVDYGQEIKVSVVAYNRKEEALPSENNLAVVWSEPSFSKDNNLYASTNTDYDLFIEVEYEKYDYYLQIKYNEEILYNTLINNSKMTIPTSILQNYSGRLSAQIIKKDNVISTYNFYINTIMIGHIKIEEPTDNIKYDIWDNIQFNFSGGFNADKFTLKIYEETKKEKKLVHEVDLKNYENILDCNLFKENTTYSLEIIASYNDYVELNKTDVINITTGVRETVSRVYVTNDFLNVRYGDTIKFTNDTTGVSYVYTTDGKDPLKYGQISDGNIVITKDAVIKIAAIKYNMNPSVVSTFNVSLSDKPRVVYISPSNQYKNLGVKSAGYTTEMQMMNRLADIIVPKLENAGIKVLRNNPSETIKDWTAISRSAKADLHLALHSNASASKNKGANQGIEAYIYNEEAPAYSMAKLLYNNLQEVYPYSNTTNKSIVSALDTLAEPHIKNVKVGVLLEIGYHDNYNDAKWFVDNIDLIGDKIATTIINYFNL